MSSSRCGVHLPAINVYVALQWLVGVLAGELIVRVFSPQLDMAADAIRALLGI